MRTGTKLKMYFLLAMNVAAVFVAGVALIGGPPPAARILLVVLLVINSALLPGCVEAAKLA